MTDDLIAFLRARLDETERRARSAAGDYPEWTYDRETFTVSSGAYAVASRRGDNTPLCDVDGEHIAANDPARVLRQVEAHRKILDMHPHRRFATLPEEWPERWRAEMRQAFPGTAEPYVGCESCGWDYRYEVVDPGWWCDTVRALARIYSDHPDFREEWR